MDAAAIADRFNLGARPALSDGPVARGKQGAVWRLTTVDGRWAVKVPFRHEDEDALVPAAAFQEAAAAAGVPAPRIRRTTDGDLFAVVDETRLRVYEWVDLGDPDPLLDPELVGAAVAATHRVPGAEPAAPFTEPDRWYLDPVGAQRWDELITELAAADAPFAADLAALRDELVALESWLTPPAAPRACHRDLMADNVLPTAAGGVCVIDWENSGPADPAQELAVVLFEFGRTDPGRARALVAAYEDAGGPARLSGRGDFSMLIAQLGHITELSAADWLRPNDRSPSRPHAGAWIREALDDPHTRERLDALLEAISR
ncbi:phosphotransferase enzyme family protein [Jiangella rhizosphaerae]|uniref:Aminoglycoside phosphotransferase family protein n=1 Tax=Jiangella rhizosphaerae TaxID=2293569 RepID=A0A418KGS9_9ACTN|nr:phosphotransferase [Jiangella rhizosphaerae]RIQ11153.1 aminoglycoside phosphotransferase family protein [Jiangella rhizosphaerae]